jgi:VWFA-related protein
MRLSPPVLVFLASGTALADHPPRTVVFDVIATDRRGRVVEDLHARDFELRENGTLQSIDEVRFIRVGKEGGVGDPRAPIESENDERKEASQPDTRLFAFFLDEYHVEAANSERVRAAVKGFVTEALKPLDLVVAMRPLDSLLTIRLTRDRDQVQRVIERFEGRRGDYTPRGAYERNFLAGAPGSIERLRAQVSTSALHALAVHLGSLNQTARKTLVAVSEGLPRSEPRRGLEALPTLESVARSANGANVSVYVVDPRPSPEVKTSDTGTLQWLAAATDGQIIGGDANLAAAMRRIAADSSAYYVILYRSNQSEGGRFHDVAVMVRKPGVTVRARQGYWVAPVADSRLVSAAPRPTPILDPPRRISPLITPWFGASRGVGGNTRVTFVWEPVARVAEGRGGQPRAARIVLRAIGADGTSVFEGVVLPTGPVPTDSGAGARSRAVFDAPPGPLRLRMSIEDRTARPIDSDVRQIAVRDLTRPVVLGTPQVFRAQTARAFRALANDPDAAPVASRVFSRTERLIIRVPVYSPRDEALALSARLLNPAGRTMRELSIETEPAESLHRIDLPLSGLAPAAYSVEITAKGGAEEARDLVEFRVTY